MCFEFNTRECYNMLPVNSREYKNTEGERAGGT